MRYEVIDRHGHCHSFFSLEQARFFADGSGYNIWRDDGSGTVELVR